MTPIFDSISAFYAPSSTPLCAEAFVLPRQTGEACVDEATEELLQKTPAPPVLSANEEVATQDPSLDASLGSFLIDEPSACNSPWFIPPNEFEPATFAKVLRESSGTLISVGTFRSLIDFTNGSFDQAILFDIDQAVSAFNKWHLALIKKISKCLALSVAEQRSAYLCALRDSEIGRSQSLLPSLKKYKVAPPSFGYYWLSDAHWSRLASAISDNKIIVQQGDLPGNDAMFSLACGLRRLDSKVSVIDISNVCNPFSEKSQKVEKILRNLLQLPLAHDAHLLFTRVESLYNDPLGLAGKVDMTFEYSCLPKNNFYRLLRS